jgi:hypothetical protein
MIFVQQSGTDERIDTALREEIDLARLDSQAAYAHLAQAGFESLSLAYGACWAPPGAEPLFFWRPERNADGDRLLLPWYPVIRAHAAEGEPVLHAAAVAGQRRAVLLLGHSGAGKSTAVRNAERAGLLGLSDDGVLVRREPAEGFLGVPLPGVAGIAFDATPPSSRRPPLAALCWLEQAQQDRIEPLGRTETLQRLLSSCLLEVPAASFLPRTLRIQVFETLVQLAEALPAYRLQLTASPRFVEVLRKTVELDA